MASRPILPSARVRPHNTSQCPDVCKYSLTSDIDRDDGDNLGDKQNDYVLCILYFHRINTVQTLKWFGKRTSRGCATIRKFGEMPPLEFAS